VEAVEPVDISIIIRTKNEAGVIEETLKRIEEQDFTGDHEIIIVDSGSTDSTLDIVKKFDVRLIEIPQERFSYGRSLNLGADNAKGEFIVNLSAHAFPRDKNWLKGMLAGFEEENVAGVYGRQLSLGRLNPFEAMQNSIFFGSKKMHFTMKTNLKNLHFSNSNSALRRGIWEKFKFDEEVPYAEDILWQTEVIEAGYSIVYVPDAAVFHTHKVSVRNAFKNSKGCAYSLALMKGKRQSVSMVLYDFGIFLALIPRSMCQNLRYVFKNKYNEHLKVVTLYVMSALLGWLFGRITYRLR
jgi:rhamnosyltransferase